MPTPRDPATQWNMVRSRPNVLRGVHAHRQHIDYLTMVSGIMILGLQDLRGQQDQRDRQGRRGQVARCKPLEGQHRRQ